MFLRSIKSVFMCLTFAFGVLFAVVLHAHGGLSLADDMCKLTVGPYTMHFTGYQPDSSQEKEFCEDIPATGRTMVALDYIEEALRPLPTEVRVIKDTGSEENLDAITILHIPAKIYPNGSINFEHNFNKAGKFVGLVTVADDKEYVSRFPFSVGTGGGTSPFLIFAIAVIIGAAGMFIYRSRQKSSGSGVAPAS